MVTAGPGAERSQDLLIDEDPDFQDVLVCVFGIGANDVRTYLLLLDNPGSTVEELSELLDRDRSNVNRPLATLREKGLANRESRVLPSGGNEYQYTAIPLEEAQELMHDTLDEWTDSVHSHIEHFGTTDL